MVRFTYEGADSVSPISALRASGAAHFIKENAPTSWQNLEIELERQGIDRIDAQVLNGKFQAPGAAFPRSIYNPTATIAMSAAPPISSSGR